jgi:hypothetical protein
VRIRNAATSAIAFSIGVICPPDHLAAPPPVAFKLQQRQYQQRAGEHQRCGGGEPVQMDRDEKPVS